MPKADNQPNYRAGSFGWRVDASVVGPYANLNLTVRLDYGKDQLPTPI